MRPVFSLTGLNTVYDGFAGVAASVGLGALISPRWTRQPSFIQSLEAEIPRPSSSLKRKRSHDDDADNSTSSGYPDNLKHIYPNKRSRSLTPSISSETSTVVALEADSHANLIKSKTILDGEVVLGEPAAIAVIDSAILLVAEPLVAEPEVFNIETQEATEPPVITEQVSHAALEPTSAVVSSPSEASTSDLVTSESKSSDVKAGDKAAEEVTVAASKLLQETTAPTVPVPLKASTPTSSPFRRSTDSASPFRPALFPKRSNTFPGGGFASFAGSSSSAFASFGSPPKSSKPAWLSTSTEDLTPSSPIRSPNDTVPSHAIVPSARPIQAPTPIVTGEEDETPNYDLKGIKLFVKRGSKKDFSDGMMGSLKLLTSKEGDGPEHKRIVFRRDPLLQVTMNVRLSSASTRFSFDEQEGVLRIVGVEDPSEGVVVYALKATRHANKTAFRELAAEVTEKTTP